MDLSNIDLTKTVVFSDLHLGLRNNSKQHNEWCVQFIEWMIAEARERGIKTCLFLGDWSHNRNSVNVVTLNYSTHCLKLLNEGFDHTVFLLGNHDLYYRGSLDIHSIPYIREFPRIHLIDTITEIGDVAFVPWLLEEQHGVMRTIQKPFICCHAEIAHFKFNSMVEMPDHGGLTERDFPNQRLVMSGHFHKRQRRKNILYIGNAFPHNFADVNDDERGIMFWNPGSDPEFAVWPGAPRYRIVNLSEAVMNPEKYINNQTFTRINVDANISYEDSVFLKDLFINQMGSLDLSFVNNNNTDPDAELDDSEIEWESIDSIVLSHLNSIESNSMDKKLLMQIYQNI
jgi:DNA repair exonuclease SbcCD nuclease subunit